MSTPTPSENKPTGASLWRRVAASTWDPPTQPTVRVERAQSGSPLEPEFESNHLLLPLRYLGIWQSGSGCDRNP